jgi:hypothetical protein
VYTNAERLPEKRLPRKSVGFGSLVGDGAGSVGVVDEAAALTLRTRYNR